MNRGWLGGPNDRPRRSGGRRANKGAYGGTSRNPLTVTDSDEARSALESRDPLANLETEARREASEEPRRRRHAGGSDRSNKTRGPVGVTHVMFLLVGLALGAALLVSTQHFYALTGKPQAKVVTPPQVKPAATPLAPPPAAVRQASTPTEAIELMMAAARDNDTATAYAQWDAGSDDLATVKRGQEMTVADVVNNAARHADRVDPKKRTYRVLSQTGTEARVGEYEGSLCLQVFSLRKRGPYWKLYNVSSP